MNNMVLTYVDDKLDPLLSKHLRKYVKVTEKHRKDNDPEAQLQYKELTFNPEMAYRDLMNEEYMQAADMIVIDSRLFENNTAPVNSRFSGEEIRVLVRRYYPFKEVIVVSQNDCSDDLDIIPKYNSRKESERTAEEYYSEVLDKRLDQSIRSIDAYYVSAARLDQNSAVNRYTIEQTINSLKKENSYQELTRGDIDRLVEIFSTIKGTEKNDG